MASLDSLPADQRAVLQLVLQRGRSYDQIAALLSIDRASVRQRALEAFDALGPQTGVPPVRRALITDYLLGQLPPRVTKDMHEQLAESASERAWARVVASELTGIATNPLAEIPVESFRRDAAAEPPLPAPAGVVSAAGQATPAAARSGAPTAAAERSAAPAAVAERADDRAPDRPKPPSARRSSRRGGAALLVLALVVIVVAVVLITGGGGSKHTSSSTTAKAPTSTTGAASTAATTTPQVLHQINLASPTATNSTTKGLADVLKQGNTDGIAIIAQNVPPNTKHDAYAVWLYNSPTDSHILGFVNPGVGTNGRLSTAGPLPTNANHYKQLIVTLETQANPKTPGKIVLQGPLAL